jgi:hypothetical protein
MGVSSEIAFDDPRLDDFANSLAKDTSALILVGEAVAVARLHLGGRALRGKVIETNLNENDIKALKKALNNKRIGTARREAVEPDSQGGMSGIVAGARRGSDPHVSPGPNISGHAPVAARGG